MQTELNNILGAAVQKGASDVHLLVNQPPVMRIHGELMPINDKALSGEDIKNLIYSFLNEKMRARFEAELELDTSYSTDFGRFRVNILKEKGQFGAAFRFLSPEIKTPEQLGLPSVVAELARKPNGLILVTGPTGGGKSTTLASIIDLINKERKAMIISLEDPIEYLHQSKKSMVRQREIGLDSGSFINGLKHTLRQDVDVILVGEIRDLDSISIALTAAETGHLVLTTLHTSDAASAITRIVDVFPANQQQQIRTQLAETLRGILAQLLLPKKDGTGRVVATEVLIATQAVRNIIRQGATEQLNSAIQTGLQYGMHTMDSSLNRLFNQGIISEETALTFAKDQDYVLKGPMSSFKLYR